MFIAATVAAASTIAAKAHGACRKIAITLIEVLERYINSYAERGGAFSSR
jgi:hypothetical protein